MADDVNITHAHSSAYTGLGKESVSSAAPLLFTKSHQDGAPSYPAMNWFTPFINSINNLSSSIIPASTIKSDESSYFTHQYHSLIYIHPSRPLREPPAIENFLGVDNVFKLCLRCVTIGSLLSYVSYWWDYWNSWISLLLFLWRFELLFTLFISSINHPPSITPVKTIVSDVPSAFVSRYDVCFRAVLEGTLSYAFILADLFVSLPPLKIFMGVDNVLRASFVGCLISYDSLWWDCWNDWIGLILLMLLWICVSPTLFIYITDDLFTSITSVNSIISDVPSAFVSRYDVCFRAVLEGTLSYAFILADLFVSLPPLKIFMGVDDVLRASSVGCLIGSVGLVRVLDLFDCLLYHWRNMVIPLFVDSAGRLVAIPYRV